MNQFVANQITDLELEHIDNFIVKEAIDIITAEVDYFFQTRETLIDIIVDQTDLNNIEPKMLRDTLNKALYSKEEVIRLVTKIEASIRRIMQRSPSARWEKGFTFDLSRISYVEPGIVVRGLQEEFRTVGYSIAAEKVINKAWGQARKQYVPAVLNKVGAKIKVGSFILSLLEVDAPKVTKNLKVKLMKLIKGSIKQYQFQLVKELSNQIHERKTYDKQEPVEQKFVQTA